MKSLKIALVADPELPIPPLLYGGIERIIDMLIEGFLAEGHKVSLFAHPESSSKAKLFPYPGKTSYRKLDVVKNSLLINKELNRGNFDLVHNFGRLLYLLPQLPLELPKIMSYQRQPTIGQIKKAMLLAKQNTMAFTGCSQYISKQIAAYAPAYPIFNGVDLGNYDFNEHVPNDAPLAFLGKIDPTKGTHHAIEVAKRTGKKLIIAGNITTDNQNYFNKLVKPELNDQITYMGAVNDAQKNILLGNASAFLMPIEWEEPFGIVMAEAMACGTPVIGFNRGSIPEVIINGYNGYRCTTIDQMVALIKEINKIDRQTVRKDAEERFSSKVIVNQYLNLYKKMVNNS